MDRQHLRAPVAGVRYPVAALIESPNLADGGRVDGTPDAVTVGKGPHLPVPQQKNTFIQSK